MQEMEAWVKFVQETHVRCSELDFLVMLRDEADFIRRDVGRSEGRKLLAYDECVDRAVHRMVDWYREGFRDYRMEDAPVKIVVKFRRAAAWCFLLAREQ
jgi:hypothetical protein